MSRDIAAMYRGPGRTISRLLGRGVREDRSLAYLMAGCALMFVAQLPRLARQAHLEGSDLDMLMGGALLGWIFIAPLALYLLALLTHLLARIAGGQASAGAARLVLFWALLSASPLFLLLGLVQGFVGPGVEANIVGLAWSVAFLWFWAAGLWHAARRPVAA